MSLRTRLTLAGGGAVFVALAIASLVIYVEVRSKLHDQIDYSLIQSAEGVAAKWHGVNTPLKPASTNGAGKASGRPAGSAEAREVLEAGEQARRPLVRPECVRLFPGDPEARRRDDRRRVRVHAVRRPR